MPATVPSTAAATINQGSASGSVTPVAIPTTPKAVNPTEPIHGHAIDARPRAPPITSDTTMMPTTSAGLSLVPKSETASCFNDAANRLMNSVPIVSIREGPAFSALTTSVTASATAAASTPATVARPAEIVARSDGAVRVTSKVVTSSRPEGAP